MRKSIIFSVCILFLALSVLPETATGIERGGKKEKAIKTVTVQGVLMTTRDDDGSLVSATLLTDDDVSYHITLNRMGEKLIDLLEWRRVEVTGKVFKGNGRKELSVENYRNLEDWEEEIEENIIDVEEESGDEGKYDYFSYDEESETEETIEE